MGRKSGNRYLSRTKKNPRNNKRSKAQRRRRREEAQRRVIFSNCLNVQRTITESPLSDFPTSSIAEINHMEVNKMTDHSSETHSAILNSVECCIKKEVDDTYSPNEGTDSFFTDPSFRQYLSEECETTVSSSSTNISNIKREDDSHLQDTFDIPLKTNDDHINRNISESNLLTLKIKDVSSAQSSSTGKNSSHITSIPYTVENNINKPSLKTYSRFSRSSNNYVTAKTDVQALQIVEHFSVEQPSLEQLLPGRRIINVSHLLPQLEAIALHSNSCEMGSFVLQKEVRKGFHCLWVYYCEKCKTMRHVTTDDESVNTALMQRIRSKDIDLPQVIDVMDSLHVPVDAEFFKNPKRNAEKMNYRMSTKGRLKLSAVRRSRKRIMKAIIRRSKIPSCVVTTTATNQQEVDDISKLSQNSKTEISQ